MGYSSIKMKIRLLESRGLIVPEFLSNRKSVTDIGRHELH